MESIRKRQAKRQIEWAREDIQFDNRMIASWEKLLERHKGKAHEGKFVCGCEICEGYKQIIANAKEDILAQKKEIREVLRGER